MFDSILALAKFAFGPPGLGEIVAIAIAFVIWSDTVPGHLKSKARFAVFALGAAAAAVLGGVAAGSLVGILVMFGPSYLTGDFIGLPWLTMLPAFGLGAVAGIAATWKLCLKGKRRLLLAVANDQNIPKVGVRLSLRQLFVKVRDLVQPISFLCLPLALGFRHWLTAGLCAVAFLLSTLLALQVGDREDGEG
jgi:hypothetical protein